MIGSLLVGEWSYFLYLTMFMYVINGAE